MGVSFVFEVKFDNRSIILSLDDKLFPPRPPRTDANPPNPPIPSASASDFNLDMAISNIVLPPSGDDVCCVVDAELGSLMAFSEVSSSSDSSSPYFSPS